MQRKPVKLQRHWNNKLVRVNQVVCWLYDNLFSKTLQAEYDRIANRYYRFYNDGDFPHRLNRLPYQSIEARLEADVDEFVRFVLTRYRGKYTRAKVRQDLTKSALLNLIGAIPAMDPSSVKWRVDELPATLVDSIDGLREFTSRLQTLRERVIVLCDSDPTLTSPVRHKILPIQRDFLTHYKVWPEELEAEWCALSEMTATITEGIRMKISELGSTRSPQPA